MSFGMLLGNQVLQRTPASTLDVYTVVSIFPRKIKETKITLDPGEFELEAGSITSPAVLHVTSSAHWRTLGEGTEPAEITTPAAVIAKSIVDDYSNSLLGVKQGIAVPGLFFVEGRKSSAQILKDHQIELKIAERKQKAWFEELIRQADSLWARTNGNPIAIPTDCRIAAENLDLKNKPWMQDFQTLKMEACPACGNLRNPNFPICGTCRTIVDQKLFNERKLQKTEG